MSWGIKEKGYVSLKVSKQERIGSETVTSWGSLEIPTIWAVLVLRGRGTFIVVGALVSVWIGRDPFPIWENVSPSQLREKIGKNL